LSRLGLEPVKDFRAGIASRNHLTEGFQPLTVQPPMHEYWKALQRTDPELAGLILSEEAREADKIRLIPSENYVSEAVLAATGTVLTNKYSEGYPGRRYYEGQQFIDPIERVAVSRAKDLFGAEHANVQPYSGSPCNLAVYLAFLEPGDTVMGMALPHGGHLTHGWNVSVTGRWFRSVQYGVNRQTGRIDYDEVRDLAKREQPKLIWAGGTAIPRTIDFSVFREIADEVDAIFAADIAHIAGLIAGGAHPSPVPLADVVTTTTHKTLRGPRGAMLMSRSEHAKSLDFAVFPGLQGGPHNHTTAAIAVALKEASEPEFKEYARQIVTNAAALAGALNDRGFDLVSGGTDNHLILIDLSNKGVGGKPAAKALDRGGIELNYNTVPFDPRKPFDPSGIRLGTPAITSRGLQEPQMTMIADWIDRIVSSPEDEGLAEEVAGEIREVCNDFPAPGLVR
jgi:glycine hydroxymethyltransferase